MMTVILAVMLNSMGSKKGLGCNMQQNKNQGPDPSNQHCNNVSLSADGEPEKIFRALGDLPSRIASVHPSIQVDEFLPWGRIP